MSFAKEVENVNAEALKYAPQVTQAVIAVEQAANGEPGSTKKQKALGILTTGARIGEAVPVPAVAGVSALIDLTVSILNAAGVFGKKTTKKTKGAKK